MKKHKNLLYIIIGIAAIVIVVLVGFLIYKLKYSAKLDLLVAPREAEILIDGKVYKNGVYDFEPGEVEIKVSMEGFESKETKLNLESNTTTMYYTYLMPIDGSFEWYLNHEEDMMLLNTIGDAEANADARNYLEKYPIVEVLPIIYADYDEKWDYTEFRVDGGKFDSCKETFCLKITDTTGGNKENAIKLISERGFNPDDYEIIYEYVPIKELK